MSCPQAPVFCLCGRPHRALLVRVDDSEHLADEALDRPEGRLLATGVAAQEDLKRWTRREGFARSADSDWVAQFVAGLWQESGDSLRLRLARLIPWFMQCQAERQTVAQFLDQWLEDVVKPSVRPKTHHSYAPLVRLHLKPTVGQDQLAALAPQHVQTMMNAKLAAGLSPLTL